MKVYAPRMGRTNIEIDDALIARVMSMYGLRTKREAVHRGLLKLAGDPMSLDEARAMEGSGFELTNDELEDETGE